MWQKFYSTHHGNNFEILSIAVDVQGASVVRPFTEKHGVTFPVVVDTADEFGQAFGLKAIPVSFLVDELGIIRLSGGGPSPAFLEQVQSILQEPISASRSQPPALESTRSTADLQSRVRASPSDWKARLALARHYDRHEKYADALEQLKEAARLQPRASAIPFTAGLVLLRQGNKQPALEQLRVARDLDPGNWRIRKQIWAIENPEKFYEGDSPDYAWQKAQIDREKGQ